MAPNVKEGTEPLPLPYTGGGTAHCQNYFGKAFGRSSYRVEFLLTLVWGISPRKMKSYVCTQAFIGKFSIAKRWKQSGWGTGPAMLAGRREST